MSCHQTIVVMTWGQIVYDYIYKTRYLQIYSSLFNDLSNLCPQNFISFSLVRHKETIGDYEVRNIFNMPGCLLTNMIYIVIQT